MKKLVLFSLIFGIGFIAFAQKRATVSKELRNISIKKEKFIDAVTNLKRFENPAYKYPELIPAETQVGITRYDRQTNATNQNRIYLYEDGTIGATWIMGYNDPGFNDRGTGYNYFDGNEWNEYPTQRLESQRSGWPSYVPLGENGEAVFAHIAGGNDDGLLINKRTDKGIGTWNESLFQGPSPNGEGLVWPRAITAGVDNNIVHLISVTRPTANGGSIYSGLDGAFLYSKSTDGAETWVIENVIPDGMTSDYYTHFNGDTYDWAIPKANTIAFVIGDGFYDMFLMKSTDGGENWDKTLIWENPYPMWLNEPTDTFYCVDGSFDVELDATGMAHVIFGINRTHSDGTETFWFPYIDGVGYWNETMPPFSNDFNALNPYGDTDSELIEDYNLIGWTQDVDGDGEITFFGTGLEHLGKYYVGLSSMVQLVMGDQNQLYVFFSSLTETYNNGAQNYRHLWSRVSIDGGTSWGPFTDLSNDIVHVFDEFVYPSCADNSKENSIYLICQIDNEPGMAVAGDEDPYVDNNMVVMEVFKDEITGLNENIAIKKNLQVWQNYPNPCYGISKVKVDVGQKTVVSLQIYNILGQKVYETKPEQLNAGSHILNIDANGLDSGVYFYTVKANDKQLTRKMIIE
ncbi:MAG: hypothetical protein B6D61_13220 [Bacteroidetes bacterium 4484_249]|nr:MAG: hypothetical protein B6D61_13220 [Bacteroidetes bacterium 4484_249]